MHEYHQALMRLRQGDSEREIARSGLMGRAKAACFRELACEKRWLELTRPPPADAEIAATLAPPRVPLTAPVDACRVSPASHPVARPGRLRRGHPLSPRPQA